MLSKAIVQTPNGVDNYLLIGVGKGLDPPRPPNRACGSPAHGSPVGGFLIGIGAPKGGLYTW
jgi:hypothetical protein